MFVQGVNLGNWLVLEKWMSPGLYNGTTAEDEYYLPTQLSPVVYEARIRAHRSEYISERDFAIIKSLGLDTVRIPVPYFIFGDCPPFIGCVEELDKAFAWAKKYGLKILIDLHTAPLSQNGFDNGGISGVCVWSQRPELVEFELSVLERLAERYGNHEAMWGIELLNEPITEPMWSQMGIQERYVPVDKELGVQSKPNTFEFIEQFYKDGYDRVRKYLPENKYVVIHDAFDFKRWKNFMREDKYKNVVLDTHLYLMMAEMFGCDQTVESYEEYIRDHFAKDMEEMEEYFPCICGEWCLFNSYACGVDTHGGQTVLNGQENASTETFNEEQKKEIYSRLNKAQIAAWKKGSGYFYWTYKMLLDTVNENGWIGWDAWDLGKCAAMGWFEADNK